MLTDHFNATVYALSAAAAATPLDKKAVAAVAAELLTTIDDLDRILATHTSFMVGTWINEARAWGTTAAERDLYEFSARNQITLVSATVTASTALALHTCIPLSSCWTLTR